MCIYVCVHTHIWTCAYAYMHIASYMCVCYTKLGFNTDIIVLIFFFAKNQKQQNYCIVKVITRVTPQSPIPNGKEMFNTWLLDLHVAKYILSILKLLIKFVIILLPYIESMCKLLSLLENVLDPHFHTSLSHNMYIFFEIGCHVGVANEQHRHIQMVISIMARLTCPLDLFLSLSRDVKFDEEVDFIGEIERFHHTKYNSYQCM